MGDIIQPPGHPISYFPALTKITGSVKAAILAQQISYWSPRAHDAEGWIYKSQTAWMDETGFTLKEFRGACEELEDRKLIKREYDRVHHELRIQLQIDAYNLEIQGIKESRAHAKRAYAKRAYAKRAHAQTNAYDIEIEGKNESQAYTKRAHAKRAYAKREPGIYQKGTWHMPKGNMPTTSPIYESFESSETTPEITTDTPPTPSTSAQRIRFDPFWKAYPKKKAKGKALKVWMRLKPSDALLQTILDALDHQKNSNDWRKEQGKFIPWPAKWLDEERWEDVEYSPPARVPKLQE